jgi:hypothetical protein
MSDEKFKWANAPTLRRNQFARLLDDPAFKDVFNDKFVEGLEKRRDYLAGRSAKVQIVIMTIMLLLSMALLSVHSSISFIGLSTSDSRDIREVLLVIASSVQLLNIFGVIEQGYIRDLLETYATKLANGNEAARQALRVRYGLGANVVTVPRPDQGLPTAMQIIVILCGGIGLIGWLVMSFVFLTIVQIAALIDIIRDPTVSLKVSVFVVIYVVLVDAATFGIQIMSGAYGALKGPEGVRKTAS